MSNYKYEGYGVIRDLKSDIPYHTDDIVDLLEEKDIHIKELEEENQQLKQQLAEKDKEIEYYKKQAKKFNNEAQKYYEDAYCNNFHNQDKISFAIEQLEKVKEWCENHKFSDEYDYVIAYEPDEEDASGCEDYLKEEINNQINELKGKK